MKTWRRFAFAATSRPQGPILPENNGKRLSAWQVLNGYAGDSAFRPQKPTHRRFDDCSTAEEVTAGLNLTGKIALITGCNAGIGYETMRALVMRGAHVYGLARTLEKAERACAAVGRSDAQGKATPFACEQTDFSSVVACADSVHRLGAPIDILICNAGVYFLRNLELEHGLEKHFVVNHLSHFILVNRLLSLIKSARQGRIVVVGSRAYSEAPKGGIDFDNLSGWRYYRYGEMYGQSKLANGLFARELARRLSGTRITANVVHPGLVMTETMQNFLQSQPLYGRIYVWLTHHPKTPERGAATLCYAATSSALENVTGAYLEDCGVVIPGGHMRDDAMATKLWAVSEELTRAYLTATPAA
jgi:NAD(P)-dependent dehydrogenase (short-subunit alcohol dehydrogenase family)